VAGLIERGRPAIGRRPTVVTAIRRIVPHGLMVAVMLWAMCGQQSVIAGFGGAVVLITAAIAYAPGARERVANREHIVDLWAMALVLIGGVRASAAQVGAAEAERAALQQMRMPTASIDLILPICLGWAALRLLLLFRCRSAGLRGRVIAATATAIGLTVMTLAG
jgi:hypothetical protein